MCLKEAPRRLKLPGKTPQLFISPGCTFCYIFLMDFPHRPAKNALFLYDTYPTGMPLSQASPRMLIPELFTFRGTQPHTVAT